MDLFKFYFSWSFFLNHLVYTEYTKYITIINLLDYIRPYIYYSLALIGLLYLYHDIFKKFESFLTILSPIKNSFMLYKIKKWTSMQSKILYKFFILSN